LLGACGGLVDDLLSTSPPPPPLAHSLGGRRFAFGFPPSPQSRLAGGHLDRIVCLAATGAVAVAASSTELDLGIAASLAAAIFCAGPCGTG
jgi:hypothetical protein